MASVLIAIAIAKKKTEVMFHSRFLVVLSYLPLPEPFLSRRMLSNCVLLLGQFVGIVAIIDERF
jgi:hypothetical protein